MYCGGGALGKNTSEYIREEELAGWRKDVAKRVKRAVRLYLTEAVMWMPHHEGQHVVRELAMSGVGDDLYDPQSPLVHAVEAALRFDPQWHDPDVYGGCNLENWDVLLESQAGGHVD